MLIKCQTIMDAIEQLAPKRLAEDWDNVGLQIGHPSFDITKVLIALDLSEEVVDEAIYNGANMIITHHPFIFKPLKNIRWDLPSGKLIKKIIQHEINVYVAHTNLDIAKHGLNDMLAEKLGLQNLEVLAPTVVEKLYKIVVFVPKGYEDEMRNAMGKVQAGWIGNYSHCTFQTTGEGTFKPLEGTNPFIGSADKIEKVEEYRVETIVKEKNLSKTINAMIKAHPYEEVAYDIYPLENKGEIQGLGRIGVYDTPMNYNDFIEKIKNVLNIDHIRVAGVEKQNIKKVGLCTGSGSEFIHKAAIKGVDAYITGDVKYHDAQQAKDLNISLIDAGHFPTEIIVMEGLKKYLDEEFEKAKRKIEVITSSQNQDFLMYK